MSGRSVVADKLPRPTVFKPSLTFLCSALFAVLLMPAPSTAGTAPSKGGPLFIASRKYDARMCRRIIFFGDSVTALANWKGLFRDSSVINGALCGVDTARAFGRLEWLSGSQPKKLFVMLGINDIMHDVSQRETEDNYARILETFRRLSPGTEVFVLSVLPTRNQAHPVWNERVRSLNAGLKVVAAKHGVKYIDLHPLFLSPAGELDNKYAVDGVHLNEAGYKVWVKAVEKYVR